jgi:hypothetical protein
VVLREEAGREVEVGGLLESAGEVRGTRFSVSMSQKMRTQLLPDVGEGGDEVEVRSHAFAKGFRDLFEELFAFRRIIHDAGMSSVSSEFEKEILKTLAFAHAKVAVLGTCLGLLARAIEGFCKVLNNGSRRGVLAVEVL